MSSPILTSNHSPQAFQGIKNSFSFEKKFLSNLERHLPLSKIDSHAPLIDSYYALIFQKKRQGEETRVEKWIDENILQNAQGLDQEEISSLHTVLDSETLVQYFGLANTFTLLCRAYQLAHQLTSIGSQDQRKQSMQAKLHFENLLKKLFELHPVCKSFDKDPLELEFKQNELTNAFELKLQKAQNSRPRWQIITACAIGALAIFGSAFAFQNSYSNAQSNGNNSSSKDLTFNATALNKTDTGSSPIIISQTNPHSVDGLSTDLGSSTNLRATDAAASTFADLPHPESFKLDLHKYADVVISNSPKSDVASAKAPESFQPASPSVAKPAAPTAAAQKKAKNSDKHLKNENNFDYVEQSDASPFVAIAASLLTLFTAFYYCSSNQSKPSIDMSEFSKTPKTPGSDKSLIQPDAQINSNPPPNGQPSTNPKTNSNGTPSKNPPPSQTDSKDDLTLEELLQMYPHLAPKVPKPLPPLKLTTGQIDELKKKLPPIKNEALKHLFDPETPEISDLAWCLYQDLCVPLHVPSLDLPPQGLVNGERNACYRNSTNQLLLTCIPLLHQRFSKPICEQENLLNGQASSEKIREALRLPMIFKHFINEYALSKEPFEDARLLDELIKAQVMPQLDATTQTHQQDASEYLLPILKDVLKYKCPLKTQRLNKELSGKWVQQNEATISLALGKNLQDMLKAYALEDIDDPCNKWEPKDEEDNFIEKDGNLCIYEKYSVIQNLKTVPEFLFLHLQRRDYSNTTGMHYRKDAIEISDNNLIDLSALVDDKNGPLVMELTGFIVFELGSDSAKADTTGHFVVYVKRNKGWYRCDDRTITSITEQELNKVKPKAYILLLQKPSQPLLQLGNKDEEQDAVKDKGKQRIEENPTAQASMELTQTSYQ